MTKKNWTERVFSYNFGINLYVPLSKRDGLLHVLT
jgi:hypothetical protein